MREKQVQGDRSAPSSHSLGRKFRLRQPLLNAISEPACLGNEHAQSAKKAIQASSYTAKTRNVW